MRAPLKFKEIESPNKGYEYLSRVVFFDPNGIYKGINHLINPIERRQSKISVVDIFPKINNNKCDCGCGNELTGRRTRWATDQCCSFAGAVYNIIVGDNQAIYGHLRRYYGEICNGCKRSNNQIYAEDIRHLPDHDHKHNIRCLAVDHVIAIKNGGGGLWLSNYQLLCHKCHVKKTKIDLTNND